MFIQTYSSIMRHTKNKKGPNATTASEPQKNYFKTIFLLHDYLSTIAYVYARSHIRLVNTNATKSINIVVA